MNTDALDAWVTLLERSCAQVRIPYVDIIFDQAGSTSSLLPSVKEVAPPLVWQSLFARQPEAGADQVAPLLVRVDLAHPLQRFWLMGLLRHAVRPSQVLVLASHWSFPNLADYLGSCVEASNGGYFGLFRYYDPRLFPLLFSHVLAPEQQQVLLRPAVFWSWLDRDSQPQRLAGLGAMGTPGDEPGPFELTDCQVETLGCAGDAAALLKRLRGLGLERWTAQQRFQACYQAMLDATEEGLIADTEREAFVLDKLQLAEREIC